MTVFGLQNTKTRSFQDIYLKCCTHVHLIEVCHIYFVFDNLKQNQYFFFKYSLLIILKLFKIFKIRDGRLIEAFILNLMLETNCFHF